MSEQTRNLNQHDPECAAALELVAAYALGATDPDETLLVERKLQDCPDVAAELAEYQSFTTAMLYSAPPVQPPAGLEKAILAAAVRPAPAKPSIAPTPPAGRERRSLFLNPRFSAALAAAAVLLLVLSNLFWLSQLNGLRDQQDRLQTQVEEQNTTLSLLAAPEANRLQLTAQSGSQGTVSVTWAPTQDQQSWYVLLYARQMPVLSPDKAYQLWLIRGNEYISAGVFQVDADGNTLWTFESKQPIGRFEALGVTAEPAGGSPAPTSPPVALGNI